MDDPASDVGVEQPATVRGGLARGLLRWSLRGLVGLAGLLASVTVTLHVDADEYFAERRGPIAEVEDEWLKDEGESWSRGVCVYSESGLSVNLALRWQKDLQPHDRLPLVILIGGHRTGRAAVDLVEELDGIVVAAIDYPYTGDPAAKDLDLVPYVPAIRRALFDTPPALSVALDWLATLPFVDPARVDLVGVSLGGPFAVIAGAADPRFHRVWSIHGAGAPHTIMREGLKGDVPTAALRSVLTILALDVSGVSVLAPERWVGRISPRPFVMIDSVDDDSYPPGCVDALWNAAREPRERQSTTGGHVRVKKKELLNDLIGRVRQRIEDDFVGPPEGR